MAKDVVKGEFRLFTRLDHAGLQIKLSIRMWTEEVLQKCSLEEMTSYVSIS
jgi:hypothetical protein